MNEADDYLKMMHEATAMRDSELKSKFKTMLFSYRNVLGMLSGLKNELDEVVSHIDNLDIETISNFYKPVLDKANDLVNKIEYLEDDIKNHSDMKAYLSSIKTQNIDTDIRRLDETINAIQNRIEKTYYQNGQLKTITPYVNGKQHGVEKRYHENGRLKSETPYVNEQEHGIEKRYDENGRLEWQTPYVNGKVHGVEKHYHLNGRLSMRIPYINGDKHGIEEWYNYRDEKVFQTKRYEHGEYKPTLFQRLSDW
jgi:antitoxin component YwqK of YwqJK toxin-antitoxin module